MTDPTSVPDAGELDSLLGAYALDALDAADRARVEAYLERDAAARAEVDEMRETAASLALAARHADRGAGRAVVADPRGDRRPTAPGRPAADRPVDELAARRVARGRGGSAPLAVAAAIAIVAARGAGRRR